MATREEELRDERLAKMNRLRARGIDPYPPRYEKTHEATQAVEAFVASEAAQSEHPPVASVAGRVTALRDMGKAAFLDLRDSSGRIQVYVRADHVSEGDFETLKAFDLGDIVGAAGPLMRTRAGEIAVQASSVTMLAKALQAPPEKWHGLTDIEQRYRQRYRDLIANEDSRQIFLLRSKIVSAMRRFLEGQGFIEVQTPVLTDMSGGAAARPFITHHNVLERDLYLRI